MKSLAPSQSDLDQLSEIPAADIKPFDAAKYIAGLPEWLVIYLEQYRHILLRNWRADKRRQYSWRFYSDHLYIWRFWCWKMGVRQIEELEPRHVHAYIDERLKLGRANSSINAELSSLRSFLRFLYEEGLPVAETLLNIAGLKQPDCLPRALSDEQVVSVREEIAARVTKSQTFRQQNEARMAQAAFSLLWQGGLRLGEVQALRLEDVDLAGKMLIVRDGKGLKDRVVYLSEAVTDSLQEYLAPRGAARSGHVFLYRNAPLKKDLLRGRLQAAGKQVGIRFKIHGLRHTGATQLLNAGCPITSIQAILGHKKLETTLIYARVHNRTVEQDFYRAIRKSLQNPK